MKFKATVVLENIYDVNPDNYGTTDQGKMLEIDRKNFEHLYQDMAIMTDFEMKVKVTKVKE